MTWIFREFPCVSSLLRESVLADRAFKGEEAIRGSQGWGECGWLKNGYNFAVKCGWGLLRRLVWLLLERMLLFEHLFVGGMFPSVRYLTVNDF